MLGIDCQGNCLNCGQKVESSGGCIRCNSGRTYVLGADGNYVVQPCVEVDHLDAAIRHAEEVASNCMGSRSSKHSQLAAWLRELKDWREGRLT